jgi:hypothetical protein
MKTTYNANSKFPWKVFVGLAGAISICCLFTGLYSAGMFLLIKQDVHLLPTPTLDLACENANCLNACLGRMPGFEISFSAEEKKKLLSEPEGYELARYWVNQKDRQLEGMSLPAVPAYLKRFQEDALLHEQIWEYFKATFPADKKVHISYVTYFVEASDERIAASVYEFSDGLWDLSINLYDFESPFDATAILSHEYGHILTLNYAQVYEIGYGYQDPMTRKEFDTKRSQCGGEFFTGYECAAPSAYINQFGNRFWDEEVYQTWANAFLLVDKEEDKYNIALDDFYAKYPDQFVTPYAATNLEEDIAESWEEFIMYPKPGGTTIADQKVQFFYEYPELVETRRDILQGVCKYASEQK